ncbi:MAG: galactose-1-phosphate uridylyltransferase [Candidatus Omnitrophota bacterium]|nr:MAG: galactose-1-phosphate uridylyltransferase [Candidatus Omnitrophota bacterium]
MNHDQNKWEQRWHPLWREWIVYAAHRNFRPWNGEGAPSPSDAPAYVPDCYLCPGNARIHGHRNPDYNDVFIFDNDHPVVGMDAPIIAPVQASVHDGLYTRRRADGIARVVCYDSRHNVSLAQIPCEKVARVFLAWREQMREFQAIPAIKFVLIFENKGEVVGVSNPHPHCQIYATNFTFMHVERELAAAADYRRETGRNLFAAVIAAEQTDSIRIIAENEGAVAFVPFFARYAYEILVFPKQRHSTLITMADEELYHLADAFQQVIRRYDLLFGFSFPYVMSILQAPVDGGDYSDYHLHLSMQPPLRLPGLKKFLAGPEIGGGNFMADTMPEEKALELKNTDLSTYRECD